MLEQIDIVVNGEHRNAAIPPETTLLELLRNVWQLTGTKRGCNEGDCGACTVLLDGRPVNACLVLAIRVHGREVTTIEGLGKPDLLHPLQKSFVEHASLQCGYCGPGMLMSAKALLDSNRHPSELEVRRALSGNLCRCTGYFKIVHAVRSAALTMNRHSNSPESNSTEKKNEQG
jgi:carbon-monoxide dehydrogenase small subunit